MKFEVGKKYRLSTVYGEDGYADYKGNVWYGGKVYTCVGHSLEGFPLLQVQTGSRVNVDSFPSFGWSEYKEPFKVWTSVWADKFGNKWSVSYLNKSTHDGAVRLYNERDYMKLAEFCNEFTAP